MHSKSKKQQIQSQGGGLYGSTTSVVISQHDVDLYENTIQPDMAVSAVSIFPTDPGTVPKITLRSQKALQAFFRGRKPKELPLLGEGEHTDEDKLTTYGTFSISPN